MHRIFHFTCFVRFSAALVMFALASRYAEGTGGSLTLTIAEEDSQEPVIARFEMHRLDAPRKSLPIRRTVPAGMGVILDRELVLEMPEATYQFKLTRGPEYRIITGNFSLERSSLDSHHVELPRMANLFDEGWVSGDCATPASSSNLKLRLASEDCHVAASIGYLAPKPIAGRDEEEDPIRYSPSWIRHDLQVVDGLAFYGLSNSKTAPESDEEAVDQEKDILSQDLTSKQATNLLPIERLLAADQVEDAKVAVENPFAWELPIWLASERIDGIFLMGDWLRLDRQIKTPTVGRPPQGPVFNDGRTLGRWAEKIYWNILEAGFRIPPLAGTGDQCGKTPVGYNRLYVAAYDEPANADQPLHAGRPETMEAWWDGAWLGKSVVTNGPLLRPKLAGHIPGHVFQGASGEKLILQPELNLSVRDPVDYLEVIHNGDVHYSARLDEFAKAGGVIPAIEAVESGWVTLRVVTLHENHFRAAMSSPWYIEFDNQPRITRESIEFFQKWQTEHESRLKKLSVEEIERHKAFVIAARSFWEARKEMATH
ncbi:MAG: hypothetical protein ACON5J_03555 [Rubripirellula sp.]